jgi:hypothetical protein
MRRIIINQSSGRKTSRATRTRAGGATKAQKRIAKLGRVGMFDFEFTLIKDKKNIDASSRIVKEVMIKTDSYDDAILYAQYNTPNGHQGLIDGQSVVCR